MDDTVITNNHGVPLNWDVELKHPILHRERDIKEVHIGLGRNQRTGHYDDCPTEYLNYYTIALLQRREKVVSDELELWLLLFLSWCYREPEIETLTINCVVVRHL